MEDGEEVGALGVFEPQRLSESIKVKPENCFVVAYSPSNCLSFFLEIGSLELLSSAGKTSCITVIVPVLT